MVEPSSVSPAQQQTTQKVTKVPDWALSVKKAIRDNQQFDFANYFQIAYLDAQGQLANDAIRLKELVTEEADQHPYFLICLNKRSALGGLPDAQQIEICWMFPLSMEKFRFQVKPKQICDPSKLEKVWLSMSDEEQLVYRSSQPGSSINNTQDKKDELNNYEPQALSKIPDNFTLLSLTPFRIDHVLKAKPQVVADSRRRPQNYESLAQPFKKDRRFIHSVHLEEWTMTEVNP